MSIYQIKHKNTGVVFFECEVPEQATLVHADLSGADLSGADLSGADLRGVNLRGSNLRGANLRGADLWGANLRGADLLGANLSGADLRDSNLRDSNLGDADLCGSNLCDADLFGANLRGADLRGSNLRSANLRDFKTDFFDVLLRATGEISALRAALIDGKVDGSTYSGECACLVGTIANARGSNYKDLGNGIKPNSSRPAEQWFMSINIGDTPETNQVSKITVEWVDEFTNLLNIAKS